MSCNKIFLLIFSNILLFITYGQSDVSTSQNKKTLNFHSYIDFPFSLPSVRNSDYERPEKFGFIKYVPSDLWQIAKSPFENKNLVGLSVVTVSSALLIWKDQYLIDRAKQIGRSIDLNPDTEYKVLVKAGNTKILKVPQNINTALYQMGEGGTSMLIAGGLFIYGKLRHDYRALQCVSDLTESFITMGIATQILKRISGRQSPFVATQPGGAWHPFPSFKDFQQNTPNYDAFPSGHLATMMATVTVLAGNYPEKKWIKPVGYTLMTLSSFAMMNTEVHWAGDYPLALALGYLSGKISIARHKKNIPKPISFSPGSFIRKK